MNFDPHNPIIQLCVQALDQEEKGNTPEAAKLLGKAWDSATADHEKFTVAYHLARQQAPAEKLKWMETALTFALKINDSSVRPAFVFLYSTIAKCYEKLGDPDNARKNQELASSFEELITDKGPFYHGTKVDLQIGDLLKPGNNSNYKAGLTMNHIYFTALVNGAGLAAALALGEGPERVYIVEPTASFENDPNVTNKKFPGNPTRSYRSTGPLKIIGEVADWVRQTPEQINAWRQKLANNKGEIIN